MGYTLYPQMTILIEHDWAVDLGVPYFCKSPFDFLVNLPDHLGPHLLLIFRLQHHIQRLQPQKRVMEAFGKQHRDDCSQVGFICDGLKSETTQKEASNPPGMKLPAEMTQLRNLNSPSLSRPAAHGFGLDSMEDLQRDRVTERLYSQRESTYWVVLGISLKFLNGRLACALRSLA